MRELSDADTERPQDQKVAICLRAWREGQKEKFADLVHALHARVILNNWAKQGREDQPRVPAGSPEGGQFSSDGGGGTPSSGSFKNDGYGNLVLRSHRGIGTVIGSHSVNQDEGAATQDAESKLATLNRALDADRLGYAEGLRQVDLAAPTGFIGSTYIPPPTKRGYGGDDIWLARSERFGAWDESIVNHELGHRGQFVDKPTFADFRRQGLVRHFRAIDNGRHPAAKKAEREGETFAESYSRWTLGKPQPDELNAFWNARAERRRQ